MVVWNVGNAPDTTTVWQNFATVDTWWTKHMWVFPKKTWYPQIIHFNRVFHYFHHPFWGTPIFGNTWCISWIDRCCNSITGDHQIKLLSLDGCILGYCQLSVSIWVTLLQDRVSLFWNLYISCTCKYNIQNHPKCSQMKCVCHFYYHFLPVLHQETRWLPRRLIDWSPLSRPTSQETVVLVAWISRFQMSQEKVTKTLISWCVWDDECYILYNFLEGFSMSIGISWNLCILQSSLRFASGGTRYHFSRRWWGDKPGARFVI